MIKFILAQLAIGVLLLGEQCVYGSGICITTHTNHEQVEHKISIDTTDSMFPIKIASTTMSMNYLYNQIVSDKFIMLGYIDPEGDGKEFADMVVASKEHITAYDDYFWKSYCGEGKQECIKKLIKARKSDYYGQKFYILQRDLKKKQESFYCIGEVGFNDITYEDKTIEEFFIWRGSNDYFNSKDYDVRGTASLASIAFFHYAFTTNPTLQTIKGVCDKHNEISQHMMMKLGFTTLSLVTNNFSCKTSQGKCVYIHFDLSRDDFYKKYPKVKQIGGEQDSSMKDKQGFSSNLGYVILAGVLIVGLFGLVQLTKSAQKKKKPRLSKVPKRSQASSH